MASTSRPESEAWTIPVIDFAAYFSEAAAVRAPVVAALAEAAASPGIFALVGHGIPEAVLRDALAATRQALGRGGAAEREGWPSAPLAGYTPPYAENVGRFSGTGNQPEAVAKFSVYPPAWDRDEGVEASRRNLWAATAAAADFRRPVEAYYASVAALGEALHGALSEALGQPRSFIKDMFEPHGKGVLRTLCYHRDHPTMASHKDLGTTTLVAADAPGLQFQPRGSEDWVDVRVPPGAVVVNVGECFELFSGGRWRATPHRVLGAGDSERCSLAYFSCNAVYVPRGGEPVQRTIEPAVATDDSGSWAGLRSGELGGRSVQWPTFFLQRLATLQAAAEAREAVAAAASEPRAVPPPAAL